MHMDSSKSLQVEKLLSFFDEIDPITQIFTRAFPTKMPNQFSFGNCSRLLSSLSFSLLGCSQRAAYCERQWQLSKSHSQQLKATNEGHVQREMTTPEVAVLYTLCTKWDFTKITGRYTVLSFAP